MSSLVANKDVQLTKGLSQDDHLPFTKDLSSNNSVPEKNDSSAHNDILLDANRSALLMTNDLSEDDPVPITSSNESLPETKGSTVTIGPRRTASLVMTVGLCLMTRMPTMN